jgi:hypothetical protein
MLTAGSPAGRLSPSLYAYQVGENRWHRLNIAPPPGRQSSDLVSQNRAWTYDPRHDLVFMVLGRTHSDLGRAEVFALRYDHDQAVAAK